MRLLFTLITLVDTGISSVYMRIVYCGWNIQCSFGQILFTLFYLLVTNLMHTRYNKMTDFTLEFLAYKIQQRDRLHFRANVSLWRFFFSKRKSMVSVLTKHISQFHIQESKMQKPISSKIYIQLQITFKILVNY